MDAGLATTALERLRSDGATGLLADAQDFLSWKTRRIGRYYARALRSRLSGRPHPWRPIEVPARSIEWTMKREPVHGGADVVRFHNRRHAGAVVGGDWDRLLSVRFEEMPKYRAVEAHFEDGVPWEETDIFAELAETIAERGRFDGCESRAELRERYREIDALYERIREEGYRGPDELGGPLGVESRLDLPTVNVGRDGRLVSAQGGGYHRISIAKLLDLEIPVRVVVRHAEWQEIRETVAAAESIVDVPAEYRQHLDHPDLRGGRPEPERVDRVGTFGDGDASGATDTDGSSAGATGASDGSRLEEPADD